jgi:hypothetical protein
MAGMSHSRRATARIGRPVRAAPSQRVPAPSRPAPEPSPPAPEPRRQTPIYIVASPRPRVGKTFLARLLTDFLRLDGGEVLAFDLNPDGDALRDYLPAVATPADIVDIQGQMALFDRLIVADGVAKVIDLGNTSFERFFVIAQEIRFIEVALRQAIQPMVLFAADPHPVAVKAYADLRRRFHRVTIVPVFNEAILKGQKLREQFPFSSAAAVPLQIPALAPMLKAQIDKSSHSFADLHGQLPVSIPIGLAFELRAWTRRTFVEFRELELRLLLEELRASLPGVEL